MGAAHRGLEASIDVVKKADPGYARPREQQLKDAAADMENQFQTMLWALEVLDEPTRRAGLDEFTNRYGAWVRELVEERRPDLLPTDENVKNPADKPNNESGGLIPPAKR